MKGYKLKSVIRGDQKISEISAASIIAKVARDRLITNMSKKFKEYAWDKKHSFDNSDIELQDSIYTSDQVTTANYFKYNFLAFSILPDLSKEFPASCTNLNDGLENEFIDFS